jgi:hypothetical protein
MGNMAKTPLQINDKHSNTQEDVEAKASIDPQVTYCNCDVTDLAKI